MTPRKGESTEDFNARRAAVRPSRAKVYATSTLYKGGEDDDFVLRWEKERHGVNELQVVAEGFASKIPAARVRPAPEDGVDDLMVGYPLSDLHMGMLSWHKETGASWDLEIGEEVLVGAMGNLVRRSPPAAHALIGCVGDWFHYDSTKPMTPLSGNLLDADSRYQKMIHAGTRTFIRAVDLVLARHQHVHIILKPGNHDLAAIPWLALYVSAYYRNEPRLTVDMAPGHFSYHTFGRSLIGVTHGHGPKIPQLPGIMATDAPTAWAACPHRFWWSGHVHTQQEWSFPGCRVDTFGVLCPNDAWAHNKGYRSHRMAQAITFHRRHGRLTTTDFNPEMLED